MLPEIQDSVLSFEAQDLVTLCANEAAQHSRIGPKTYHTCQSVWLHSQHPYHWLWNAQH